MKKLIIITACLAIIARGAYAQTGSSENKSDVNSTLDSKKSLPDVKPLIVLDDKMMIGKDIKKMDIDVNTIASIQVLKDSVSVAQYGEVGKQGVVIITSKNYTPKEVRIADKAKPLVLIDGIETAYNEVKKLPKDSIKDFYIVKDSSSLKTYGYKAANGVILVTTKNNKDK